MKCPSCGEDNRDDALICGLCKRLFRRTAPLSVRPTPAAGTAKPTPTPPPHTAARPRAGGRWTDLPLSRGGIVIALLLAAMGFAKVVRLIGRVADRQRAAAASAPASGEGDPSAESADVPIPARIADVVYESPPPGRPLLDRVGEDSFGYPLATPDRLGLLALLHHRRFAELTEHQEWFQAEFERDSRKELWPAEALWTFDIIDPEVGPLLDAWVAASPDSFAPWAARAVYRHRLAWVRRGSDFAEETAAARLAGMAEADQRALADVKKALQLRPGLVTLYRVPIWASAMRSGDASAQAKLVERGLDRCPDCFGLRASYLYSLIPRWGGSYEAMAAFVERSRRRSKNPRLQVLAGYEHLDRCELANIEKQPQAALAHCDRAVAAGDHREFLRERAHTRAKLGDHRGALEDLDRALVLRPQDPELLRDRAASLAATRQWGRARLDLNLAQRLDPGDERTGKRARAVADQIVYAAFELERGGRQGEAISLYDEALRVAPNHADARARRRQADLTRSLLLTVEREPNSLEAHVKLDHHLAQQRRFEDVVALWTRFIARRPEEPRAYFERGGALFHHGRRELAFADLDKACTMGLAEACATRERMKGR
jgi:tetratricopeptide (TPR) repeat protein